MAKEEQQEQVKTGVVTETPNKKTVPTNDSFRKIGLVLIGVLIVIAAFASGAAVQRSTSYKHYRTGPFGNGDFAMGPSMGMRGQRQNRIDDDQPSNASRIGGVVTAVNGSAFTVAGNGTTNTVQTTANTVYTGATKVAVNDSVVAMGTTTNGTFTALHVVIRTAN